MNKYKKDILKTLMKEKINSQRMLAEISGYSLGIINKSLKCLRENDYLNEKFSLTRKAIKYLKNSKPKRAIILAAGFGMRMVPINTNISKAFLEVRGEKLIERLIKQLQENEIYKIYVVVGFMREKFDYLIDKYNVNLVVNSEYANKNNLHSLNLVKECIEDSYIVPCDIYCEKNPFERYELYSWYMVSDKRDDLSEIRVNKKMELVKTKENGNKIIGISYIMKEDVKKIKERLEKYSKDSDYDDSFWEEVLYSKDKIDIFARVVTNRDIKEVDTYEDLLELDKNSINLKSEPIEEIIKALNIETSDIKNIEVLKKGMTNRSFLFEVKNKKYIMRIPGEGTEQLINRKEEKSIYDIINNRKICDDVIYINSKNGYKITEFIPNGHSCDIKNIEDLKKCMKFLKEFHDLKLEVEHEFNVFEKINFYEKLWGDNLSEYDDYFETKKNIYFLKNYIDENIDEKTLTHIDAIPDNFLIFGDKIRLLDWEYAAMQDPHIDIAMFAIYALYDKDEIDRLINIYFENNCKERIRIKIYAYISVCGLLWSNWCEYKRNLGVEFGEYSLRQYRYAKDFYKIVKERLGELGEN